MRILKLRLENFAPIYSGMGLYKITLDFTKCDNHITLLVGKNGSGKTAILSQLQPFAYVGTLDSRSKLDLILPGKEGFKFISFYDDKTDTIYDIEHRYLYNTNNTRSVHSFFKVNGEELNRNGSVTKFNELIKLHFGLDQSFLRIIRLGTNVNSIVSMKSSERKDFISTFLSDLSLYDSASKVINERYRNEKKRISMLVDFLDRIPPIEKLDQEENEAMEMLRTLHTNLDEVKLNIFVNKKSLSNFDDYLSRKDLIKKSYLENKKYQEIIDKEQNGSLQNNRKDLIKAESELSNYKSLIKVSEEKLKKFKETKAQINENLTDNKNKLELLNFRSSVGTLEKQKKEIEEKIKDLESEEPFVPICNSLDYLNFFASSIQAIINDIANIIDNYSGYEEILRNVCIDTKIEDIPETISSFADKEIKRITSETKKSNSSLNILFVPRECSCFKRCPYYIAMQPNNSSKRKYKLTLEDCLTIKDLASALKGVFEKVNNLHNNSNKTLAILSQRTIEYKYIILAIFNTTLNLGKGFEYVLDVCNKSKDALLKKDKLDELYTILGSINESLANSSEAISLQKEIKRLEIELVIVSDAIEATEDSIKSYSDSIVEIGIGVSELQELFEKVDKFNANRNQILNSIKEYESLKESDEKYNQINNEIKKLERLKAEKEEYISKIEKKISNIKASKSSMKFYRDELEQSQETFDIISTIRDSLSSTKGIPLIFIRLYLKNIQLLANKILHDIFDSSITLQDFVINEKEFSIPYSVNGIHIKDVDYASQGQKAAIIMAISFALLRQYMSRYNILLLDELDAPLYKENKEKFIFAVENQMLSMGCDQCIMITHNNFFENYPVNIIYTSNENVNDFNKANVICDCLKEGE